KNSPNPIRNDSETDISRKGIEEETRFTQGCKTTWFTRRSNRCRTERGPVCNRSCKGESHNWRGERRFQKSLWRIPPKDSDLGFDGGTPLGKDHFKIFLGGHA